MSRRALPAMGAALLLALGACSSGDVEVSPSRAASPAETSVTPNDVSRFLPAEVGGAKVEQNAQSRSLQDAVERGEGVDDAAVATVGQKPSPDALPDMLLEVVAGRDARKGALALRDNLTEQLLGSVTQAGTRTAGDLEAEASLIRSTQRTPPEVVFLLAEDGDTVLVVVDFRGDEAAALDALAAMAKAGGGGG